MRGEHEKRIDFVSAADSYQSDDLLTMDFAGSGKMCVNEQAGPEQTRAYDYYSPDFNK